MVVQSEQGQETNQVQGSDIFMSIRKVPETYILNNGKKR